MTMSTTSTKTTSLNAMESSKQDTVFISQDGQLQLHVALEQDTVWLTQAQMCELFDKNKRTVSEHIRNVFKDGELDEGAVVRNIRTTAKDGKTYNTNHYNLDVIISVGYRVKSQRGVQFRQWATRTLKQHLVEGYTINQQRLVERGVEFDQALHLLSKTLTNQALVNPDGEAVLHVIADYARSWSLLQCYDEQSLAAIEQGFGEDYLYPNVASRAAHLLYFIIKNHPFADGNKRTGSFLFLWYLPLNQAWLG